MGDMPIADGRDTTTPGASAQRELMGSDEVWPAEAETLPQAARETMMAKLFGTLSVKVIGGQDKSYFVGFAKTMIKRVQSLKPATKRPAKTSASAPAGSTMPGSKKHSASTPKAAAPLTAAAAEAQAKAEGLTLERAASKSGYKGVSVEGRRFLAQLARDGRHLRLGNYETAQEAALVYARAAKASPSHTHSREALTAAEVEVRRQRKASREAAAPLTAAEAEAQAKAEGLALERAASASGYKGVYVKGRRFKAELARDGQNTSLGVFETAQEAALNYARAAEAHDTTDAAKRAVYSELWERPKDNGVDYAARKLEEVEQRNVAAARREEDERRRRLQTEHERHCQKLVQGVRDAPDGAAGEAIVEELQQAMDLRSDQVWEGGSRRYLWAGDERKEAVLMLRGRRQREGKARSCRVPCDLTQETMETFLVESLGRKVYWLFCCSLPYMITWYISNGLLDARFATVAAAFREAGWCCKLSCMFNTVGFTVRTILQEHDVPLSDIMALIVIFAENPPCDERLINVWTQYAYWCTRSRYNRDLTLPDGEAEIKHGDTQEVSHFDNPSMTNQSAVSRRYGGLMYEHIMHGSEYYLEGRGTRELRALVEMYFDWLASEVCHEHGFRVHEATGDEGLLGPSGQAEAALRSMMAAVQLIPAFQVATPGLIFTTAGQRTGGRGWHEWP
jgi:hypothetical protein